jgi:hypothetical protein
MYKKPEPARQRRRVQRGEHQVFRTDEGDDAHGFGNRAGELRPGVARIATGVGADQGMDKPIIDDELWKRIEPLLPPPKARREKYPGRKPVPDRAALSGIVFVLRTGLRWRDLPAEMGCGSFGIEEMDETRHRREP